MNWTEEQWKAKVEGLVYGYNPPAKRHKFGVSPRAERTVDGIVFASKAEAMAYQELLVAKAAGRIIGEIERQPKFPMPPGFAYVGDFRVTWADGTVEVLDVKGMETPVFKLKRKCLAFFYPEVKLSIWRR